MVVELTRFNHVEYRRGKMCGDCAARDGVLFQLCDFGEPLARRGCDLLHIIGDDERVMR